MLIITGCSAGVVPSTPSASSSPVSPVAREPTIPPSAAAVTPAAPSVASAAPTSSSRPAASPSPTPAPGGPKWREIGGFPGSDGLGLVGLDDGYLATEEETDAGREHWFSNDGRHWQATPRTVPSPGCPPVEGGICDLLAIKSGWEAFAAEPGDNVAPSFWRSADGVAWERVSLPADVAATLTGSAWAAPDGTTLMVLDPSGSGDPTQETLGVVEPDGSWRSVDLPTSCPGLPFYLVLPRSPGRADAWAVSDGSTICVSSDLQQWRGGTPPLKNGESIVEWVGTKNGIVATGTGTDSMCDRPFQMLSADGLHWTRLKVAIPTMAIVDGPAGVLAISGDCKPHKPGITVWRLDP